MIKRSLIIWVMCWLEVARAQSLHANMPAQAPTYLPMLKAEITRAMPTHRQPSYFGGLVEQESCISLTHSKCWNPRSQLKTSREEGAGFGQITRAYRNGRLRFDALADGKQHIPGLSELSWDNVYQRPDLQLRLMVGMVKQCNDRLQHIVQNPVPRYHMCDAAYNGGIAGVLNERRACHLSGDCDANRWFGHVERHCLKSKKALYGQRNACDINRQHVRSVFLSRRYKYKPYLGEDR
ncbi:lytic murein transglycosylase [Hydromonas duriensis]|uniref:Lysozyme n=1 Tax=Hydromonas duriensis TaxID=1527608 RepID=A0A4R6Y1S6_9BURK|nr:lytic murein transglycosylase [Hydromonas duriensis]TDR30359.1 hypothetical protein DFR44_12228 [Hydromonas duriensis]